jgi:hypothetical protein
MRRPVQHYTQKRLMSVRVVSDPWRVVQISRSLLPVFLAGGGGRTVERKRPCVSSLSSFFFCLFTAIASVDRIT